MGKLFPHGLTGIIFDCDGVMVDSRDVNIGYYNLLLREVGKPPITPEQAGYVQMSTAKEALEYIFSPEELKLFQLSEQHRRLVVINVQGLRRKGGSLLPEYSEEEFGEATFTFVKYYVQSRHYDELVEENKKLKFELDQEVEWRNRTDN